MTDAPTFRKTPGEPPQGAASSLPSAPSALKLPAADAADILLAEALEAHPPKGWTQEHSDAVSRDARAVAGERATAGGYLTTRARLELSRMRELGADLDGLRKSGLPDGAGLAFRGAAAALVFLGFFSGAVTDQLTSSGAVISLLSPPCLGLLAWNAAAILLALPGLFGRDAAARVLRGAPASLARGLLALERLNPAKRLRLARGGAPAEFLSRWLGLQLPALAWRMRSALHLAAFAFGAGLAISLLVRGIGAEYSAGWSSTWFAERPDIVARILDALYGWIPQLLPGVAPMPDAAALELMRIGPAGSGAVPGAQWLARIIWMITLVVLLPRALLAGLSLLAARRASATLTLEMPPERLEALLAAGEALPAREALVLGSPDLPRPGDFPPEGRSCVVDPWSAPDFPALAGLELRRRDRVTLVLDPAATPEEEVHGALLDAIREKSGAVTLALDFSELARRFSDAPAKLRSRRALWEHFAELHGAALRVSGLPGEEAART